MEFFCGSGPECQSATNQNEEAEYKTRMLEKAKQRVLNDYFVIGVLEQFEDSLRVFEKLLPRYYRGALDVYHSKSKFSNMLGNLLRGQYRPKITTYAISRRAKI